MILGSNSWVYPYSHPTEGGSAFFTMRKLTITAGAGFYALGTGYLGGPNYGTRIWGWGPGAGGAYGGASHGGSGGTGGEAWTGSTYGSSNAPVEPGSGGGAYSGSYGPGGDGGGAVRILASGQVYVDGSINADGHARYQHHAGGGAGGSIHIRCSSIAGTTGSITANGGEGRHGGGGGRIAVYSVTDRYEGSVAADGGPADVTAGGEGTIVWVHPPARGTVCIVR
jgi:hypothetical protein